MNEKYSPSSDINTPSSRSGNGQGCLVCYSPWGHKESDTTEQLNWTDSRWDAHWEVWETLQLQFPSSQKKENRTSLPHGSLAWPLDYFDQWNASERIKCLFRWKHLKHKAPFSTRAPTSLLSGWQHYGMEVFPPPGFLSSHDEQMATWIHISHVL